jgi:plastocyanin
MRKYLLLTSILLSLLLSSQEGWSETVEVKIIKSTFIPAVIKIKKGDTVRWVNTEELLHTVTSGKAPVSDGKFNASYVKKEFEVTLDKAGFYDYYCELHPAIMRGVVIVDQALESSIIANQAEK